MKKVDKKHRIFPERPEWRIILEHLVYQDPTLLYRICRKMIIYLDRLKIFEIYNLIEVLNPMSSEYQETQAVTGENWPKPKGLPFIASEQIEKVFKIADTYLTDEEITKLLTQWIKQERISNISLVLEKRHAPLAEITEVVKRFFQSRSVFPALTEDENVGLRVSLIVRLLSENLKYINIAKKYVNLESIAGYLDRIVGPAQGNGKLGGKSSGLILAFAILKTACKECGLLSNVKMPRSWFFTSDGVFEFIHYNALEEFVFTKYQNQEEIDQEYPFLQYIFKNSYFPPEAYNSLSMVLDDLEGRPIIVRSSSLLEDSFEAAFSGKYKSLFISNIGTKEERISALMSAISEVYASTFGPDPIEYRKERGLLDFREEMGLLIQEVVGTKIGKYYLPSFAGVAFSNNEFRWAPRIKREDGVIRLVAGLGTRAVDRTIDDYPKLISPGQPSITVNSSYEDQIKYSQQYIDVINLETNKFETIDFHQLIKECNGNYPALARLVSLNKGDTLMDPISHYIDFTKEDTILTFNSLLKNTNFIAQINMILKELKKAFGRPVDIEFASDGELLYLLQCRPQSQFDKEKFVQIPPNIPEKEVIFTANQYVNNGIVENIEYVVYVDSNAYTQLQSIEEMQDTGRIVSRLNRLLERRKFILIGPGRWGSKGDIKLGVPVIYSDINNTAMLIEVARSQSGYVPELSFGTHFFQDLVEANIKYLPLYPDNVNNIFNEDFFYKTPNSLADFMNVEENKSNAVKLIRVGSFIENATLSIYMDGDTSNSVAFLKR